LYPLCNFLNCTHFPLAHVLQLLPYFRSHDCFHLQLFLTGGLFYEFMNRSNYETEVHGELKDNGTYKEIKEDLTTKIENKIKKNVEGMYKRSLFFIICNVHFKIFTESFNDVITDLFYIHIKPTVTSRIWCPVRWFFKLHRKKVYYLKVLNLSLLVARLILES
jgi:hypothetical protein